MDGNGILGRLGEIAGGVFGPIVDNPIVRLLILAGFAYVAILWLASAWWTYRDLRGRHHSLVLPYLAAALVVLASPILFPFALIVYVALRPAETIAGGRIRDLEDELERLSLDEVERCRECHRLVAGDWLTCPSCRTRIGYECVDCGRRIDQDWSLCAWCGGEFGGRTTETPAAVRVARRRAALRRTGSAGAVRPAVSSRRRRPARVEQPARAQG